MPKPKDQNLHGDNATAETPRPRRQTPRGSFRRNLGGCLGVSASRRLHCLLLLVALLPFAGCHTSKPAAAAPETPRQTPVVRLTQSSSVAVARDAAAGVPLVFQVQIFVITTPQGSFSSNEDFWKRINEQCVDPGTSDLLQKNGIRVGVAPFDELEHLDKFLDGVMPVQQMSMTAAEAKNMEVEMKSSQPLQHIFHLDKHNELAGQDFEDSSNFLNISFAPTPRKLGQLRLTVCPMVRGREHMQYVRNNDQYELQYVSSKSIYDLNFTVDIPVDSFLIVTPSPEAHQLADIVGNAFFIKDAPAERQEQVMLVLPQPKELHKRANVRVQQTRK